jgi:hypothetical protein
MAVAAPRPRVVRRAAVRSRADGQVVQVRNRTSKQQKGIRDHERVGICFPSSSRSRPRPGGRRKHAWSSFQRLLVHGVSIWRTREPARLVSRVGAAPPLPSVRPCFCSPPSPLLLGILENKIAACPVRRVVERARAQGRSASADPSIPHPGSYSRY